MSELNLEPVAKSEKYKLLNDFSFFIKDREIHIPKGIEYDGASIPKLFWSLLGSPFEPDFMEAALIHDYCFYTKCCGFMEANNLFKSKLKLNGVGYLRRVLMWSAVSSVGWLFWQREDKASLQTIYKSIMYRWDWLKFECDIKSKHYLKYFKMKGFKYGQ